MNNKIVKKLMAAGLISAAMFAQADTDVVGVVFPLYGGRMCLE